MIMKMAHEDSAMHRFMCGNLETLKKEGIRKNLLDFHEKYYSANIMNLVKFFGYPDLVPPSPIPETLESGHSRPSIHRHNGFEGP